MKISIDGDKDIYTKRSLYKTKHISNQCFKIHTDIEKKSLCNLTVQYYVNKLYYDHSL